MLFLTHIFDRILESVTNKTFTIDVEIIYECKLQLSQISFKILRSKGFEIQFSTLFNIWQERLNPNEFLESEIIRRDYNLCPICLVEYTGRKT